MTDFTLQQIVLRFCALLLIVGAHGAAVAGAATALGDQGPRYDGRLSVNPLAHLDLLGLISGVLFSVGWIKPVAIDPGKLYPGHRALIAAATTATGSYPPPPPRGSPGYRGPPRVNGQVAVPAGGQLKVPTPR